MNEVFFDRRGNCVKWSFRNRNAYDLTYTDADLPHKLEMYRIIYTLMYDALTTIEFARFVNFNYWYMSRLDRVSFDQVVAEIKERVANELAVLAFVMKQDGDGAIKYRIAHMLIG